MSNKFTQAGNSLADLIWMVGTGFVVLFGMKYLYRLAAMITIPQWIFNVQYCDFKWAERSWDNVGYFMGMWLMIEVFSKVVIWGMTSTWAANIEEEKNKNEN